MLNKPVAMENLYYDSITGHKYEKHGDNLYAEFNKKGDFLKYVRADQPHLAKSRHIHLIKENSAILYVKRRHNKNIFLILPVEVSHPEGWSFEKVLAVTDKLIESDHFS